MLAQLGVAEKFRAFAPAVDPKDPAGAKALDDWAKANPELLKPSAGSVPSNPMTAKVEALGKVAGQALQDILAGKRKSTLVTQSNLSKLI